MAVPWSTLPPRRNTRYPSATASGGCSSLLAVAALVRSINHVFIRPTLREIDCSFFNAPGRQGWRVTAHSAHAALVAARGSQGSVAGTFAIAAAIDLIEQSRRRVFVAPLGRRPDTAADCSSARPATRCARPAAPASLRTARRKTVGRARRRLLR